MNIKKVLIFTVFIIICISLTYNDKSLSAPVIVNNLTIEVDDTDIIPEKVNIDKKIAVTEPKIKDEIPFKETFYFSFSNAQISNDKLLNMDTETNIFIGIRLDNDFEDFFNGLQKEKIIKGDVINIWGNNITFEDCELAGDGSTIKRTSHKYTVRQIESISQEEKRILCENELHTVDISIIENKSRVIETDDLLDAELEGIFNIEKFGIDIDSIQEYSREEKTLYTIRTYMVNKEMHLINKDNINKNNHYTSGLIFSSDYSGYIQKEKG